MGAPSGSPFPWVSASPGGAAKVPKRPNFIEFYKISRSLDPSGTASVGRKIALHRQRDRGHCSFCVRKTTQRKSKAHTPRYTQSVFSMHWYRMRERWVTLASSAEFHEGSRTWPDGRIRNCYELACRSFGQAPMIGPTTVNLGVAVSLRGLSYPPPKLPSGRNVIGAYA